MSISPTAARMLEAAARSGRPNAHLLPVPEARRNITSFYQPFTGPELAEVTELTIPVRDGEIRGRAYRSSLTAVPPVVVYFHGGGWILGNIDDYDVVARAVAHATGCLVVSVDYRRGPEFRFPTAVDDALDSVRWCAAHAGRLGGDVSRLVVLGDSAGGNLATVAAARCRREGGPPVAHQVLIYPVTTCDLGIGFDRRYEGVVLQRDELRWHQHNYLANPAQRLDPWVSPLLADLDGLPPATVVLAECDPIGVQGRLYGEALAEAGVSVEIREFPGMIHGFFGLDAVFPEAADALAYVAERLRSSVGAAADGPYPGRGTPGRA